MSRNKRLMNAIDQLDTNIEVQWGRVGLMQRWLADHATRLDDLSERVDASLARIESLLAKVRS